MQLQPVGEEGEREIRNRKVRPLALTLPNPIDSFRCSPNSPRRRRSLQHEQPTSTEAQPADSGILILYPGYAHSGPPSAFDFDPVVWARDRRACALSCVVQDARRQQGCGDGGSWTGRTVGGWDDEVGVLGQWSAWNGADITITLAANGGYELV